MTKFYPGDIVYQKYFDLRGEDIDNVIFMILECKESDSFAGFFDLKIMIICSYSKIYIGGSFPLLENTKLAFQIEEKLIPFDFKPIVKINSDTFFLESTAHIFIENVKFFEKIS
jgi:hypothetical protein